MSKIGEYEVSRFLEHAQANLSLSSFLMRPDKRSMELIAKPDSEYCKWMQEEYSGDYSFDNVIAWLHAMKEKHPDGAVSILDYGDSFGVQWTEKVKYTEKEREEAREWLLVNPEEPGETVRFWRRDVPFDVPKFEE